MSLICIHYLHWNVSLTYTRGSQISQQCIYLDYMSRQPFGSVWYFCTFIFHSSWIINLSKGLYRSYIHAHPQIPTDYLYFYEFKYILSAFNYSYDYALDSFNYDDTIKANNVRALSETACYFHIKVRFLTPVGNKATATCVLLMDRNKRLSLLWLRSYVASYEVNVPHKFAATQQALTTSSLKIWINMHLFVYLSF